jgi:hypothetical protein
LGRNDAYGPDWEEEMTKEVKQLEREVKIGLEDKLRVDLVPPEGIFSDARAITFGAKKYSPNSWRESARHGDFAWSVAFGALQRHLLAWWGGEETDPESGLSHLDHAGANLKFLQTFLDEGIGIDDRP